MEKITKELFLSYLYELHSDAICALNYTNDYELLISIILSAQTTDKAVNKVTKNLFNKFPNFESLSKANLSDVEKIIQELGLYHNKAKNIINTSIKMVELGYEKVPCNFDTLVMLPGVGRKTANVFLAEFYNQNTLGVDTHIMRVSKRLNIASEPDDAYKVENKLKTFVGEYNYKTLHHMLIAFGRNECKAINPLCEQCKFRKYCKKDDE